jgi:hypothetical protein
MDLPFFYNRVFSFFFSNCLFVYRRRTSNFSAFWRLCDSAENVDLCLTLVAFSSEGSFTCHTCCNTGRSFLRSYLKGPWFSFVNADLSDSSEGVIITFRFWRGRYECGLNSRPPDYETVHLFQMWIQEYVFLICSSKEWRDLVQTLYITLHFNRQSFLFTWSLYQTVVVLHTAAVFFLWYMYIRICWNLLFGQRNQALYAQLYWHHLTIKILNVIYHLNLTN